VSEPQTVDAPEDGEFNNLSEVDYYNRTLPTRERPFEVFSSMLSAAAIVFGLAAFVFDPYKLGFTAIGFGIIGLATAGDRDRFARIAMVIAALCWVGAGFYAVLADKAVW
jgi:hypothetical protein